MLETVENMFDCFYTENEEGKRVEEDLLMLGDKRGLKKGQTLQMFPSLAASCHIDPYDNCQMMSV